MGIYNRQQKVYSCALKLTAPIPSGSDTVTLRENTSSFSWLSPSVPVGKSSTRGAAFCSSGNSLCTGSVGKGERRGCVHAHTWRTLHHVVSPGTEEESRSLLRLQGPEVAAEESCTAARAAATSRPPRPPTSGTWLGCTTWLSPWFDMQRGKHTPVCSGAQEGCSGTFSYSTPSTIMTSNGFVNAHAHVKHHATSLSIMQLYLHASFHAKNL